VSVEALFTSICYSRKKKQVARMALWLQ